MIRSRSLLRVSALAIVAATCAQFAAAADKQRVTLAYQVAADADCPDEASFKNLVAARLGYDPFVANGQSADAVRITITRDRTKLVARATVTRGSGPTSAPRELVGDAGKCEALGAAMATSLAIVLDPLRALSPPPPASASASVPPPPSASTPPPPPPPMATAPPTSSAPPPPPPPPPTSPDARPPLVSLAAAFILTGAEMPSVGLGANAGVSFRFHAFSIEALGRVTSMVTPVTVDSGDRVSAATFGAEILPCGNVSGFSGCGVLRLAAFQGYAPDVVSPSSVTTAAAWLGARVGWAFALGRFVSVRPTLEGAIALVRTSFLVDRTVVWTAPPVDVTAGIGVLFHLR